LSIERFNQKAFSIKKPEKISWEKLISIFQSYKFTHKTKESATNIKILLLKY